jgi:hypothetical protein
MPRGRGASALGLRPLFARQPGLLPPAGDGRFVPVAGPAGRLVWTPGDGLAQAADLARMRRDATCQLQDGGETGTGPDLAAQARGFGAARPSCRSVGPLFGRETPRRSRRCSGPERRLAPRARVSALD